MFGLFRSAAQAPVQDDVGALFARFHVKLQRRVGAVVDTTAANVEDACMYAWLQFLRYELDETPQSTSWLTTVAIREAVKLDRADRRNDPIAQSVADRPDPRDHIAARDQLAYAAAIIQQAGLTAYQLQALSLQMWGLSYAQIAESTGKSRRAVERQLARANEKITEVIEQQGG